MTPALSGWGLAKRFRRVWGVRECTLTIPEGAIVGLVGPNAAGKSTLLALAAGLLAPSEGSGEGLGREPLREPGVLAAGLLAPSEGSVEVLGRDPLREPDVLAEVGFLAQGAPLYRSFTVSQAAEFARRTNPRWDTEIVAGLLGRL